MASVAIVGAGIGGTMLATALQQRRISYQLFERRDATRFGGGALILWSNAMRALARVGLAHDVAGLGAELHTTDFKDARGTLLWRLHTREIADPNAPPSMVVPRARLLGLLDAGVQVQRHAFQRFELTSSAVRSHFAERDVLESHVLVGADGLRSSVRAGLFGSLPPPRATAQSIWVGLARLRHPLANPGHAVAGVGQQLRFWYVAPSPTEVHWYATFPEHQTPANLFELAQHYRGWYAPVEELIQSTAEADVHKTSIADRAPSREWGYERVTLLGDAIHAVTPDLGQGACQAMESAVVLAQALAQWGASAPALREYERLRRVQTARVTNLSYLTAVGSNVIGPGATRARDWGIANLLPRLAVPELRRILRGAP
jgi:2-polyprenyl-6-methoxyphenol hydroxylase-like FAD-dependent oxidoreductase